MIMNSTIKFKNRPNIAHNINGKEVWESRSVAVIVCIFGISLNTIYVLAEKRSNIMTDEPGKWVLPGGYLDWDESGWDAVHREVFEETGFEIDKFNRKLLTDNNKEPFYTKTDPSENRQNIALNYYLVFDFLYDDIPRDVENYKNEEIDEIKWIPFKKVDSLKYDWAFDHNVVISKAFEHYYKYNVKK